MARPKKDPAIRQKEFTDAAEKLFFETGYDATSVQDVLKAVGGESLSPSVFYYYFSSKEDLFEATISTYVSRYIEGIAQILRNDALGLSSKTRNIIGKMETAIHHFLRVESFFINDKGYSRHVYNIIAQNVFACLIGPAQELIENSVRNGLLPETDLIKAMGTRRMAYLVLYASYSLFHKENEANYLAELHNAVKMLPLLLEQILSLPPGSLEDTV
jgi:AcrR family transcriptional regulator